MKLVVYLTPWHVIKRSCPYYLQYVVYDSLTYNKAIKLSLIG